MGRQPVGFCNRIQTLEPLIGLGYKWVMIKREPVFKDGIKLWKCSTCGLFRVEAFFYYDSRTPNRLKSQCKKCHKECNIRTRDTINARRINRESMRRRRKIDPEKYRKRDREASRKRNKKTPAIMARQRLNSAVMAKKITVPSRCSECNGRHKLTAHHGDYSKPLNVEWLCYECHGRRHWKN